MNISVLFASTVRYWDVQLQLSSTEIFFFFAKTDDTEIQLFMINIAFSYIIALNLVLIIYIFPLLKVITKLNGQLLINGAHLQSSQRPWFIYGLGNGLNMNPEGWVFLDYLSSKCLLGLII